MHLGDRDNLKQLIHEITNIPCPVLTGAPLDNFRVEERISWSNQRQTTRVEDKAYSLLGIFGLFTFLNYGEGERPMLSKGYEKRSQKTRRDRSSGRRQR